jgi:hypothetical protein
MKTDSTIALSRAPAQKNAVSQPSTIFFKKTKLVALAETKSLPPIAENTVKYSRYFRVH